MLSTPLLRLSPDILIEIGSYLDAEDLIHLIKTCKRLHNVFENKTVWLRLCKRIEGLVNVDMTEDANYKRLYLRWKKKGYVYTWGEKSWNRLGRLINNIHFPHHKPIALTGSFAVKAIQVAVGGYGIFLLDENGKLRITGKRTNSFSQVVPELDRVFWIHAGREYCLAMTDGGNLWQVGVNSTLCLTEENVLSEYRGKITIFRSGWDSLSAFVPQVGFLLWKTGKEFEPMRYEIFRGRELFDVSDYVLCAGFIIFTTKEESTVFRFDLDGNYEQQAKELTKFRIPIQDGPWKLFGSFYTFSCISNDGNTVYMGNESTKESDAKPIVHDFLQNQGLKQLAHGDYHHLILKNDGTVWSWGMELSNSGCLGLGTLHNQIGDDVLIDVHGRRVTVLKPRRIFLNATCTSIAAGGWQSAMMAISDKVLPDAMEPARMTSLSLTHPSVPVLHFLRSRRND
ncbi:F-box protein Pof9 [Schizosaccharomyces cryophilus OY26]|uniref:F-box protein Pof9 n=1 Tax=Schizosaccharomyces cryophilus (strain OY26 / ATCC MYA-4695 / CBS 11777 / NBRC 106824 / NRRL Y48691) TaxID=653667 RepID=S9VZ57_SCHCR|nr:F-box protein Pof9 [Schizosaccharomyces cryophilus OY26]EPY52898.1 F-box protein Pof9 [Schizosaccharomyces cryophilus OY26]